MKETIKIAKEALALYFKPLAQLWKFVNKPLPDKVCWGFGKQPPCKICWGWVGVIALVVAIGIVV